MTRPIRPQRWTARYPNERLKLDMDASTRNGIVIGLVLFIVVLAVSNLLRTGSVIA